MSPIDYVLSSWKMYLTVPETERLFGAVHAGLRERLDSGAALPRVILCPDFVSLARVRAAADEAVVALGAQDCHWEDEGPYTGGVSARMLRGVAEFVLVGHSERRDAGDTDDHIARKVAAAARNGLVPILLVGEDDRAEDPLAEVEARLRRCVSLVDVASQSLLYVYEPKWAIGTDTPAPADRIRRSVLRLKEVLRAMGAGDPKFIYGGSVDERNIEELLEIDALDGVGVGRASLDADRFLRIIDAVSTPAGGGLPRLPDGR